MPVMPEDASPPPEISATSSEGEPTGRFAVKPDDSKIRAARKTLDTYERDRRWRAMRLGALGRMRFILKGAPPHPVEVLNDIAILWWGLWVVIFPAAFDTKPVSLQSAVILAPPFVWGMGAICLGIYSLAALLFDGRPARAAAALIIFVVYLFIGVLAVTAEGVWTPRVPLYAVRALGAAWVYVRLERDRKLPG